MRNWKTAFARTAPQKIYGRKAAGNFLALPAPVLFFCKRKKEQVLEGQVRNWKTAHARTAPQKIYGRKAAGNFLQKKKRTGAGRVSAELE